MMPLALALIASTATPAPGPSSLADAMNHLSNLAACVRPDQIDRVCVSREIAAMTPQERAALTAFLAFDRFYGQHNPEDDRERNRDRDEPPGM